MLKFIKKRSKKIGLPPGTMVYVGEKKVEKIHISVLDYDHDNCETRDLETIEEVFPYMDTPTVSWININGLHEVEVLEKIGSHFKIHPLVMEDILNTDQRPKIDMYDEYLFIVVKMLSKHDDVPMIEQVSIIMGPNFVITFQEHEGDVFGPLRERIKNGKGRVRKFGADYLTFAIIDILVDNYFLVLEKIGESVEKLEGEVIDNPQPSLSHDIHMLKQELIFLRRSIWPLREVISTLTREEIPLMSDSIIPYIRDLYDHTIQVIDTIETFRDMVSGILDVYLSSVSNRMNEVMKVLTIIATIFIPLTFIAGIYGMNFEFMPELKLRFGYPLILLVMFAILVVMVYFFRRKKWL